MSLRRYAPLTPLLLALSGCTPNSITTTDIPGFDEIRSAWMADVNITYEGWPVLEGQTLVISNVPDLEPHLPDLFRAYSFWRGPGLWTTTDEECDIWHQMFAEVSSSLADVAQEGNTVLFITLYSTRQTDGELPDEPQSLTYRAPEGSWVQAGGDRPEFVVFGATFRDNGFRIIRDTWNDETCPHPTPIPGAEPAEGGIFEETPPPTPTATPAQTTPADAAATPTQTTPTDATATPVPTPTERGTPGPTPPYEPFLGFFDERSLDLARSWWFVDSGDFEPGFIRVKAAKRKITVDMTDVRLTETNTALDVLGVGYIREAHFTARRITVQAELLK